MREKIARALSAEDGWIWEDLNNNYWSGYFRRAGLAISVLIVEIKKELLTDTEILVAGATLPHLIEGNIAHHRVVVGKLVAQAQLQKIITRMEGK